MSTFKSPRKALCPPFPGASLFRCLGWQGQEAGIQRGTSQRSPLQDRIHREPGAGAAQKQCPLRMSYSYCITEKESEKKKNPPSSPKEETKRETLQSLIPPEIPLAGCECGCRSHPACCPQHRCPARLCAASILLSIRKHNRSTTRPASFLSTGVASEGFLNKMLSCF